MAALNSAHEAQTLGPSICLWGLQKLTLRESQKLKIILHALLIPGTRVFLPVASNHGLNTLAFKVLGFYLSKANSSTSHKTNLDKKAVEYIVVSSTSAPEPGLISLHLGDCSLRVPALDLLARVIHNPSFRNVILRHNRTNAIGAVALALMIRGYPHVVPTTPNSPTFRSQGSDIISSAIPLSLIYLHYLLPMQDLYYLLKQLICHTHLVLEEVQQQHNLPRSRFLANLSPSILKSTGRFHHPPSRTKYWASAVSGRTQSQWYDPKGPNPAFLDMERALDALSGLGVLCTADLQSSDLRNGLTYLARVFKRNRTLEILNLSQNKLDI
ncbi:hypothetical protein F4604DRAFT_2042807 [Suillus subluteus]|nr:hypothetical protein F4604DRAFT_2042807 [Suillus subluteus]